MTQLTEKEEALWSRELNMAKQSAETSITNARKKEDATRQWAATAQAECATLVRETKAKCEEEILAALRKVTQADQAAENRVREMAAELQRERKSCAEVLKIVFVRWLLNCNVS